MQIGIIGSGPVAKMLGIGLKRHGYEVMISSRDSEKRELIQEETDVSCGSFEDAASFGDLVILSVKGLASENVVSSLSTRLSGKTVIDTTNPISENPPVNGVLQLYTSNDESLMERLQRIAPEANFVKAFSCVGNMFMVDPKFEAIPTMFICGNNEQAKKDVADLLEKVGWEAMDMGMVESARAIEPLCILWCLPGFRENKWNHAFKMMETATVREPVFEI